MCRCLNLVNNQDIFYSKYKIQILYRLWGKYMLFSLKFAWNGTPSSVLKGNNSNNSMEKAFYFRIKTEMDKMVSCHKIVPNVITLQEGTYIHLYIDRPQRKQSEYNVLYTGTLYILFFYLCYLQFN